jgi:hypothetical protein
MYKILALILTTMSFGGLLCSSAYAWDNCGVGRHRTDWGQCVWNYAVGPGMRGCPAGYHWGNHIHGCFPN